ncbi:hypothetical protein [Brumimicrobium mesophilum]|uniref:hypothetical protein n=1 Tax=Brumimicrobium mesophilum TaxID=392717 RepID=UPI000D14234A|nr:hypothetical protein [Brumimicrobium mesophilum]
MKVKYLFPSKYKKIGWIILIPSFIFGLISFINGGFAPEFLTISVPSIISSELFSEMKFFSLVKNNILDEILLILVIVSSLMVAFSKEKTEDEFIAKIRLESLVWAVYVNYGILLLSILFIYDLAFLNVMIFNMFTILLFFVIRFNWQLLKLKKSASYEE